MGIKVTEMTEATQVNNNDLFMIVQNGENKKITKENLQGSILASYNSRIVALENAILNANRNVAVENSLRKASSNEIIEEFKEEVTDKEEVEEPKEER